MFKKILILLILCLPQIVLAAPVNFVGFETGDSGETRSTNGTFSIQSTIKRTGTYSLRINPTTTNVGSVRIDGISSAGAQTTSYSLATSYHRFYLCAVTFPAANNEEIFVVQTSDGTTQKIALRISSAGKILVYDSANSLAATSTATLSTQDCADQSDWTLVELKSTTSATASSFTLKIDGATDTDSTCTQTNSNAGGTRIGKNTDRNNQTVDYYIDDYQVNDAAFPGAGAIKRMIVDSDGSSQTWTGGTNASNYLEVDETVTDGDTTYVASSTSGAALFGFESSSSAGIGTTINSVKAWTRFREGVDGTAATKVRIRANGTNTDSGTNNGGTSYFNRVWLSNTDPSDAGAWTTTDLNGIEAGLQEDTASQVNRLTTVMMMVDYVPDTATPTPTFTPTGTPTPTATPTPTPTATATFTPTPVAANLPLLGVGS